MRSKRNRSSKPPSMGNAAIDDLMKMMYEQGKAQFGSAVKSFWFYDGDLCPACLQNFAGVVNYKGKDGLAINGFMYRERGVLISYFLCEVCALFIHEHAQKHPYQQTPLHVRIETNLRDAYHGHLALFN